MAIEQGLCLDSGGMQGEGLVLETNSNFDGTPHEGEGWIESFQDAKDWTSSVVRYEVDNEGCWREGMMHGVGEGVHVFRVRARHLRFTLSQGSSKEKTRGCSAEAVTVSRSGRYFFRGSSLPERISDACVDDCLRSLRPKDRFVELFYESDPIWLHCFVMFTRDGGSTWKEQPGSPMRRVQPGLWFVRLSFRPMEIAFHDGRSLHNSTPSQKFCCIGVPGKYRVSNHRCRWIGPSDLDLHI
eukprot:CAMPEP_0184688374 /NCGR_PEP_ID=MMETSP0312-20130426/29659_1 /TAXON_ID=31354 /ORGANISM="Compsopogon coeruleus, Strain SAG 36.94" /LENGTH=240 /DNA_ID=CAMNT_0027145465 /DNA_START=140 /DNA_END=862 /DNA_ORIENTATION=-